MFVFVSTRVLFIVRPDPADSVTELKVLLQELLLHVAWHYPVGKRTRKDIRCR